MNPEKAQLKIAIINDLGADMEDLMESSQRRAYALEGAGEWMGKVHQGLVALSARVDDDRENGRCTQDQATYAKKFLAMAMTSATDLTKQAVTAKLGQEGVAEGIKRCVEIAKKKQDRERLKLEAEILRLQKLKEEMEANGEDSDSPPPRRPRSNAKAKDLADRKAKAKAEKEDAEAEGNEKKEPPKKAPAKKKAAKKKTTKRRSTKRSAANT